jgi:hypothetical protein
MIKVWGSVLLAAGALLLASPSFAQEACSASPDLNGDGTVDVADFEIMKAAFGTQSGDSDFDAAADLNNDGLITTMDYRVMLECS